MGFALSVRAFGCERERVALKLLFPQHVNFFLCQQVLDIPIQLFDTEYTFNNVHSRSFKSHVKYALKNPSGVGEKLCRLVERGADIHTHTREREREKDGEMGSRGDETFCRLYATRARTCD